MRKPKNTFPNGTNTKLSVFFLQTMATIKKVLYISGNDHNGFPNEVDDDSDRVLI